MEYNKEKAHYIVVTAIIYRRKELADLVFGENYEYLIVKRSKKEKMFPSLWTVPGGKIEMSDYVHKIKDTKDCWYNVIEHSLKREVMEETGIEITSNISYVASMTYIRPDNIPTLCMSFATELPIHNNKIVLCNDLTDYAWVTLQEAKSYELIEGIWNEIQKFDQKLVIVCIRK